MNICQVAILVLTTCCFSGLVTRVTSAHDTEGHAHFINEWAAEIPGGEDVARRVASDHGYHLVRAFHSLADHYVLARRDVSHVSRRSADHHTEALAEDKRVLYAAQQQEKFRDKRGAITIADPREVARKILSRDGEPDDPEFKREWYINPSGETREDKRVDLKVRDVWKKGITGKGVVVTILDDGVEGDHPDLKDNYDPKASWDFNDNDDDPYPRYDETNENNHGTRCAGEIAMVANNDFCGVGIAFDSKFGGCRILDGRITDSLEGDALGFRPYHVNIISASWGPKDNGSTCEGPGPLATKGFQKGIQFGRGGLGSIYVWASGNGGYHEDSCACDGFTSSIFTVGVSSASQRGTRPMYGELCASTITTTYSSGSFYDRSVTTSDMRHKCTSQFSGTSAAAPMAAGILALLLEANPNLTWRDVQHIVIHTSRMAPLVAETGWYRNGAGYCVNLAFGFGLMDALAIVELADPSTWKNVGEQHLCEVDPVNPDDFPRKFSSGKFVEIKFETDGCKGQDNEIKYLEHIQVVLDITYEKRGHIYVQLVSAMGTKTDLMHERKLDNTTRFEFWPFMSTHNWGEQPQGTWTVIVGDRSSDSYSGAVNAARLVLFGTEDQPEYQKTGSKNCADDLDTTPEPNSEENETAEVLLNKIKEYLQKSGDKDEIKATIEMLQELVNSYENDVEELTNITRSLGLK